MKPEITESTEIRAGVYCIDDDEWSWDVRAIVPMPDTIASEFSPEAMLWLAEQGTNCSIGRNAAIVIASGCEETAEQARDAARKAAASARK